MMLIDGGAICTLCKYVKFDIYNNLKNKLKQKQKKNPFLIKQLLLLLYVEACWI